MSSVKIAPSLLAADFGNLQRDVEMVNDSAADWHHLDIMDGVFVPNISYGMPVIKTIATHATKPLDVHLMIVDPDRYIQTFADLGANILSVHYEACPHLHRTLQAIKEAGKESRKEVWRVERLRREKRCSAKKGRIILLDVPRKRM